MLLVMVNTDESDPLWVMLIFQRSILSVVTGGMVSMVVSVVRSYPVEVDTAPLASVVVWYVAHATSRDVVYSGKVMVVVLDNVNGGSIYRQGGSQWMTGFALDQILGSMYTSPEDPELCVASVQAPDRQPLPQ